MRGAVQQRSPERRGPPRGVGGDRRAEPVSQPDRPRPAGDRAAEQPQRQQQPADHVVPAGGQTRAEADHPLGRLHRARQVAVRAAPASAAGPSWPARLGPRSADAQARCKAAVPCSSRARDSGPSTGEGSHQRSTRTVSCPDWTAPRPIQDSPVTSGRGEPVQAARRDGDRVRQPGRSGRGQHQHPGLCGGQREFQADRGGPRGDHPRRAARAGQRLADGQASGARHDQRSRAWRQPSCQPRYRRRAPAGLLGSGGPSAPPAITP